MRQPFIYSLNRLSMFFCIVLFFLFFLYFYFFFGFLFDSIILSSFHLNQISLTTEYFGLPVYHLFIESIYKLFLIFSVTQHHIVSHNILSQFHSLFFFIIIIIIIIINTPFCFLLIFFF